ncbi:helix-turn-helix transcriptional regulator [Acetobacter conturbans]|uniref:Helix-turn-helix domain-containing protein n=1 Tax=Acetobacter conturbans TaxID=1737472 RepID=A0ABX0K2L8_9PROT|nr:helix-turn-helix transcriptional regulator [Acetobacter conturbans]NHN89505.1 helix-turn-helix domain-containing protein [Acetobacter conturbans]
MSTQFPNENALGVALRKARLRLDPAALGFSSTRRRTPGLRREEVAQRANISVTWYIWLEQGRGGTPSSAALERIASALLLTDAERENLFLLGLGRPPQPCYRHSLDVTPRLQRVLDALDPSPGFIRSATWDMVAWNRAATELMTDFALLPPEQRNILRLTFLDPRTRQLHPDWENTARFIVSAFRVDSARAGAATAIEPLVRELCVSSPEFSAMWQDETVYASEHAAKIMYHPLHGPQSFEVSTFGVDGRPDLILVVYNPVAPA